MYIWLTHLPQWYLIETYASMINDWNFRLKNTGTWIYICTFITIKSAWDIYLNDFWLRHTPQWFLCDTFTSNILIWTFTSMISDWHINLNDIWVKHLPQWFLEVWVWSLLCLLFFADKVKTLSLMFNTILRLTVVSNCP